MANIAIVLGYKLNNDGSCNKQLVVRLKTLLKLCKEEDIDKIILSGGVANPNTTISEAKAMYNYLTLEGFPKDKLLLEEKSIDTGENAINSIPLAISHNATKIYLVSSKYHFTRPLWNAKRAFENELKKHKEKIELVIYSDANLEK